MIELQIITKILDEKSSQILVGNSIDSSYFHTYTEEIEYILEHEKTYGNIPDKASVLSKFNDLEFVGTNEGDSYLISTLLEEHTYSLAADSLNNIANVMQEDSIQGVNLMLTEARRLAELNPIKPINIIESAQDRYDAYVSMRDKGDDIRIPSGFEELDDINKGFNRGEEFVFLFARTGQGKSWVLIKMLEHAWKMNNSVALIETEMSATKTGYRFDTLNSNFLNSELNGGREAKGYEEYINTLKDKKTPFYVANKKDFGGSITVGKLRNFCVANNVKVLGIDGIVYLTDDRKPRAMSRTQELTNIGEDLMDLSTELGILVIAVGQSNRAIEKGQDLDLTNIRESDGIAHNASLVIAIDRTPVGVRMLGLKNRNGRDLFKLNYTWDINSGTFSYMPDGDDGYSSEESRKRVRDSFKDEGEGDF